MRASWRMEEGYGDPTPALCAHPRQLRLCTRTVKQIPRRAAHGVPLGGRPSRARPVAADFGNATSVQFQANPARTMELWFRNVCIPSARARGPAEYADHAQ